MSNSETKIFAKGWCFKKIFIIFVIGCVIGVYYEEILNFIRFGNWSSRSGLIYGPLNPIYGLGATVFIFFLGKYDYKRKWYFTYLYSCLLGGATEFGLSLIQEYLFKSKSWDYSGMFLNIDGRTTVPIMLIWGILGLILLKVIYPFVSKIIEKIPYHFGNVMFKYLVIFMCFNMIVSYSSLFRMGNRRAGQAPLTFVGEIYDKIYPDEFMLRVYANMEDLSAPSDIEKYGGGN